ncbi:MAG: hypothetical protein NWQ11_03440, partial [Pseudomonadales bacterium]|nr:hypothetical protein [Pseudomonadales bacterium]
MVNYYRTLSLNKPGSGVTGLISDTPRAYMALPQLKGGAWAAAQNQEAQLGGITRRHNHKTKNGAEER